MGKEYNKSSMEGADRNTANEIASGLKTGASLAKTGAKLGGRVATDAATAGAAEAVNAPMDAIEKGKDALEKVKKGVKKAEELEKDEKEGSKGALKLLAIGLAVVIFMESSVASVFPRVVLNAIGAGEERTGEEVESENLLESLFSRLTSKTKGILSFFLDDGVTEQSAKAFSNVSDYDSSIAAFDDVLSAYLASAVDKKKADLKNHLTFEVNGETIEADYDLTLAEFENAGNPFASADHAALLAAYALTDTDFDTSSLGRFEKALTKGEDDMLSMELSVMDENGNLYTDEVIEPLPLYKYNSSNIHLSGDAYIDYLSHFPEGHELIKEAAIESINADIASIDSQISSLQSKKDASDKKAEKKGKGQKAAKEESSALSNQIAGLNGQKASLQGQISALNSGSVTASLSMVKAENMGTHLATIYKIKKRANGDPWVTYQIDSKEGEIADTYVPYNDAEDIFDKTFVFIGQTHLYPNVVVKNYAKVTLSPYNNTNVFKIFGIDPKEPYSLSKNNGEITNEEMFNHYYDILAETTGMASYKTSSGLIGHACTLSKEEIQVYLDIARSTPLEEGSLSKNRLQLIKTALSLTGAIYYDWGAEVKDPGWNSDWWMEKAGGYVGLDCAEFVKWALWTTFDDPFAGYNDTGTFCTGSKTISRADVKPGDFGVIYYGGSGGGRTNHIGIYVGRDASGKDWWVHCTGNPYNTVVVNNTNCFKVFLRNPAAEIEADNRWIDGIAPYGFTPDNADPKYVIARTLTDEGGTDVGFLACAEAICNYTAMKGNTVNVNTVYATAMNGHYLDSYHLIFELGKTNRGHEPTMREYQMLDEAIAGKRRYIQDARVGYWRAWTMVTPPDGMAEYAQIPKNKGNHFLYYK